MIKFEISEGEWESFHQLIALANHKILCSSRSKTVMTPSKYCQRLMCKNSFVRVPPIEKKTQLQPSSIHGKRDDIGSHLKLDMILLSEEERVAQHNDILWVQGLKSLWAKLNNRPCY